MDNRRNGLLQHRVTPPPMPTGRFDNIIIEVNNSGLNQSQIDRINKTTALEYIIHYSGDFKHLDFFMEQIANCITKNVRLVLGKVIVTEDIMLPFHILKPGDQIIYTDSPGKQSNFYTYIINTYPEICNEFLKHTTDKMAKQIKGEREIQRIFLRAYTSKLLSRRRRVEDYSKEELMDEIFDHVCTNYPYNFSIINPDGSPTYGTTEQGGTAYATFNNRSGVCAGRCRLIKLFANNKVLQIPCYIVEGSHGQLGHAWNEFIDDQGNIIEYDSSFGLKCIKSRLPSLYKIEHHEPDVVRRLKQIR